MKEKAPTVLVVDDDDDTRVVMKRVLSAEGFHVVHASDGEAALRKLREFRVDALVLDLMMPKKDGFAVLEHVRSIPSRARIPVIVASASADLRDIQGKLGVFAALEKPFDLDVLLKALRDATA